MLSGICAGSSNDSFPVRGVIRFPGDARTGEALPRISGPQRIRRNILSRQWMAAGTMRPVSGPFRGHLVMLAPRHGNEMRWIHAASVGADVMNVVPRRNRTDEKLVADSVRAGTSASRNSNQPVSLSVSRAAEVPASGERIDNDSLHQALAQRAPRINNSSTGTHTMQSNSVRALTYAEL